MLDCFFDGLADGFGFIQDGFLFEETNLIITVKPYFAIVVGQMIT